MHSLKWMPAWQWATNFGKFSSLCRLQNRKAKSIAQVCKWQH